MGVFDRFSEKKNDGEVEVYPETQDFGEGIISVRLLLNPILRPYGEI